MSAAAIPAGVLDQLRSAGLKDDVIFRFLTGPDAHKAHGATALRAVEALRMVGAPHSLTRAYVEHGAKPARIVADLLKSATLPGAKLPAASAAQLKARIDAEGATTASIWGLYRVANKLAPNSLLPGVFH